MRVSTIPYNFQSSNFEHVNRHIDTMDFGVSTYHIFPKEVKEYGSDDADYSADKRGGVDIDYREGGNVYATEWKDGVKFYRQGTYTAYGAFRVGPELDGDSQVKLKDVTFKNNNNLTSTWLGDVIGLMYRYSASGSYGEVNSARVNKLGLCYIDPNTRKIVTYYCRERIGGIPYGEEPANKEYYYSCAVMLDTGAKNLVISKKLKYVGIVCEHYHKHTTGDHSLTGTIWNVRPIINSSTDSWEKVKNELVVNANSSGRKVLVPHPNTTWSQYSGGEYQIKTY